MYVCESADKNGKKYCTDKINSCSLCRTILSCLWKKLLYMLYVVDVDHIYFINIYVCVVIASLRHFFFLKIKQGTRFETYCIRLITGSFEFHCASHTEP